MLHIFPIKMTESKASTLASAKYFTISVRDQKDVMRRYKQHTKKTKEALFSTKEQLHEFQKIVSELIADKDLKTALDAVPGIYTPRKKIELDQSKIQKAQAEQTKTVDMLNEMENEFISEDMAIGENDHEEPKIT